MTNLRSLIRNVIEQNSKFIVVTGGVCSSLGKGVLVSSIGVLLKSAGYAVSVVKYDPYLNVDPGTMSPLVHGEVFVTQDGAETDLDLGHYERMLGVHLNRDSSVSSGQIFKEILDGEREGRFLGNDIQLVPHVVDAIKQRLLSFALKHKSDFVLLEIGGTVGDLEGQVFLEAVRQVKLDLGASKLFHAHLSYVPYLEWAQEVKTKPTQHSIHALKHAGLIPDSIFLRIDRPTSAKSLNKLSVMCGISKKYIFQVPTCRPIYHVFVDLEKQEVAFRIQEFFSIPSPALSDLSDWKALLIKIAQAKREVSIGLIAKYVGSNDPYISVIEAIKSAGYACDVRVNIVIIDAEKLEQHDVDSWEQLKMSDGIVGPGGFDVRGTEGKIAVVSWAREQGIPYFGLCLGLQVMLIEIGRSLVGLKGASSTEFDKHAKFPIISMLSEQQAITQKGASMRLGEQNCTIFPKTRAYEAYGTPFVKERHRHRYEFNNAFRKDFEKQGVVFSGVNSELDLIEIAELEGHPFMLGVQFHPEFLSTPLKPHPLFLAFMNAVVAVKDRKG